METDPQPRTRLQMQAWLCSVLCNELCILLTKLQQSAEVWMDCQGRCSLWPGGRGWRDGVLGDAVVPQVGLGAGLRIKHRTAREGQVADLQS